jgi:hypothetical protein
MLRQFDQTRLPNNILWSIYLTHLDGLQIALLALSTSLKAHRATSRSQAPMPPLLLLLLLVDSISPGRLLVINNDTGVAVIQVNKDKLSRRLSRLMNPATGPVQMAKECHTSPKERRTA